MKKKTKARRPGTIVEEVYRTLRDRILKGEYYPGSKLSQNSIADELRVSRTPLREALSRLMSEGLVVGEANRGLAVAPIHDEEAEQSYALRLMIEPIMMGAIVPEITEKDIILMERALSDMERSSHHNREFQEAHYKFHQIVHKYYPVDFRNLIDSLYSKIYRHQRLYFSRPNVPEDVCMLDREFCRATRERNSALGRQVIEFHLVDAALGLILDVEPDYRFSSLLVALRGIDIELTTSPDSKIRRPAQIRWKRKKFSKMREFKTQNLRYHPTDA